MLPVLATLISQGHFTTPLFASIDEIEYKEWLYMVLATSWKVILGSFECSS